MLKTPEIYLFGTHICNPEDTAVVKAKRLELSQATMPQLDVDTHPIRH